MVWIEDPLGADQWFPPSLLTVTVLLFYRPFPFTILKEAVTRGRNSLKATFNGKALNFFSIFEVLNHNQIQAE
jgi:hypothetical protein